jgi:phospholipase/carboxylesterase
VIFMRLHAFGDRDSVDERSVAGDALPSPAASPGATTLAAPREPRMSEPDDLVQSADYAFAFRRLEPAPDPPHSLLVLLHGVGGDEDQLESLGSRAPDGMLVVLPRGHRSISGGNRGWFRVGMSEDGLQVVEDELHEARARLAEFIHQLQQRHDVPPERTWLGGFSQGGILTACVALTEPGCAAGFAMLAGRLLPEIAPLVAPRERLRGLDALLVHGRDDEVLPVDGAREAARALEALGVRVELQVHPGGHELTAAMEEAAGAWLSARSGVEPCPEPPAPFRQPLAHRAAEP